MNELETAIYDELAVTEYFQEFFLKVSIMQTRFNKNELKSLSRVVTNDAFISRFGGAVIVYMNDNIHKERVLPFNNISEKTRIRRILEEYETDANDKENEE